MEVIAATSFDERFDPSGVLNTDMKQFWVTTGLYPQELTISFNQARVINEVKFASTGIKKAVIQGCQTQSGNSFKEIGTTKELGGKDG